MVRDGDIVVTLTVKTTRRLNKLDLDPQLKIGTLAAHHTEQLDPDAEEIQSGQEEADEGLWLLWNNKRPDSAPQGQGRDYTSLSDPFTTTTTTTDATDIRSSSDEEDIEDRLEQAKARAKHAEDYARSDRNCCCIIS